MVLHTLCKRAHWRRNLHVRTLVAVVKIRLSRPRPLTLRFLPGLTRALTKIASNWIFRPCGWPLFFPGKRKGHMDEFVHVAVNCKLNTYGHHGYKPDWLVSMRYKPLSEIAVIIRMIKLCCFDSIHDQHSFMQRCSLWLVSKRILIFSSCQHKQKTYIRLFQFLYGEECQGTLL